MCDEDEELKVCTRRVEQDNSNGSCNCLENPTGFANG